MRNTLIGLIVEVASTTSGLVMRLFIHSVWPCSFRRARSGFFAILDISTISTGRKSFPHWSARIVHWSMALTENMLNADIVHPSLRTVALASRHRSTKTSIALYHLSRRRESPTILASVNFWVETGSTRRKIGHRRVNEPLEEMAIMDTLLMG